MSRQYAHRYGRTTRGPNVHEELLAVVGPADERRVAEEEHADGDHPAPDSGQGRVEGERHGGGARLPRQVGAGAEDGEGGDARGHERDDEHLHHRVQALVERLPAARRPVGDRGGSVAGFVRVHAAGEAVSHRDQHGDGSAGRRPQRERLADHQRQHVGQAGREADQHDRAAAEIEADLDRREPLGRASDGADAADDHQPRQHGDDHAGDPGGTPAFVCHTRAIELVWVNGVVVSAATPATSA